MAGTSSSYQLVADKTWRPGKNARGETGNPLDLLF